MKNDPVVFKPDDKVVFVEKHLVPTGFAEDSIFTVGAVLLLQNPNGYDDQFPLQGKERKPNQTRLQARGHPQILFIDGIPDGLNGMRKRTEFAGLLPAIDDPEGEGRQGFSGACFEKIS